MPKARRRNTRKMRRTVREQNTHTKTPVMSLDTQNGHHPVSPEVLPSRGMRGTAAASGFTPTLFPAMVALGCWGMVVYFLFLTTEANHVLFAGIATLMALLWSYNFSIRLRKLLKQKSRT